MPPGSPCWHGGCAGPIRRSRRRWRRPFPSCAAAPRKLNLSSSISQGYSRLPGEVALRLLGCAVAETGDEGPVELAKLEALKDALDAALRRQQPLPPHLGRGGCDALAGPDYRGAGAAAARQCLNHAPSRARQAAANGLEYVGIRGLSMGAGRPYIVLVNDAKPPNFSGQIKHSTGPRHERGG